ncbi:MarR family winged helix-turn-helix transcriptional regulator [Mesorhizobium sp. ORM8.1]
MRPFELTDRVLLAQYGVSRLLARLEADGLVEKLPVSDDGRGQIVRITSAGRDMRRRIWGVYGASIAGLMGEKLSAEELETLARLLGRLRHPSIER